MTVEEVLLVTVLQNQRAMLNALAAICHVNGERDLAIDLNNLSKGVKEMLDRYNSEDRS